MEKPKTNKKQAEEMFARFRNSKPNQCVGCGKQAKRRYAIL